MPVLLLGFGRFRALVASILLLLLLKLGCCHLLYLLLDKIGEARSWSAAHRLPHVLLLHQQLIELQQLLKLVWVTIDARRNGNLRHAHAGRTRLLGRAQCARKLRG